MTQLTPVISSLNDLNTTAFSSENDPNTEPPADGAGPSQSSVPIYPLEKAMLEAKLRKERELQLRKEKNAQLVADVKRNKK